MSDQMKRLNQVRAALTARGIDRNEAARWIQQNLAAINSGGSDYAAVLSAAKEMEGL